MNRDFFVDDRDTLMIKQDEPGESFIIICFWDSQVIGIVQVINFQSSGKNKFIVIKTFFYQFGEIMFIFNFTENFFNNIFNSNDTAVTAKFINNQGDALMFTDKSLEEFVCRHCFRNYWDIDDFGSNLNRIFEYFL